MSARDDLLARAIERRNEAMENYIRHMHKHRCSVSLDAPGCQCRTEAAERTTELQNDLANLIDRLLGPKQHKPKFTVIEGKRPA